MTIQQCKYAIKIAEVGSFSKAAKQLFIAQSSLSGSIKALEDELHITIFERCKSGVYLTEEGAEFIRYASQIAEQSEFISERYNEEASLERLYISTQHYDFVADIFGKMLADIQAEKYRLALRETQTYRVIREIENAYSDIGILAIKGSDAGIMQRYLSKKGLRFTPFLKVFPHVFLRKAHPLAGAKTLCLSDLAPFPYVSYAQGEHNNTFFMEEILHDCSDKHIEISDRASLMNVLLSTDCYTVGTGLMPSALNSGKIISVPFASTELYTIGYLLHENRKVSALTEKFIALLTASVKKL